MNICFIICISGIHLASHYVQQQTVFFCVRQLHTHFFIYHVDSQGKYDEKLFGPLILYQSSSHLSSLALTSIFTASSSRLLSLSDSLHISVHFRPVTRQLHYNSRAQKISWCVMKKKEQLQNCSRSSLTTHPSIPYLFPIILNPTMS